MRELLEVDNDAWQAEVEEHKAFFGSFGKRLPAELQREMDALKTRLTSIM